MRLCFSLLAFFLSQLVLADDFQILNDTNTKITFELDTTWHTVHGNTSQLTGTLWTKEGSQRGCLQAELRAPVALFDTDSRSRDEELREVMAADKFPEVIVKVESSDPSCSPKMMDTIDRCAGIMLGTIQIRDVVKEMKLPYELQRIDGKTTVSGKITFEWAPFGVEDPSMLLARVDKDVSVKFHCDLDKDFV